MKWPGRIRRRRRDANEEVAPATESAGADANVSTRRSALKRGVLLVAGAIGVSAARTGVRAAEPSAGPEEPSEPSTFELVLYARHQHALSRSRRTWDSPEAGDQLTGRALVFDAPGGREVGELYSAGFALDPAGGSSGAQVERMELHTFRLDDGTIIGTGAAGQIGGRDVFAVVGGTGRYAGVRGSYEARQSPFELGGDGSAEFVFTMFR